MGIAKWRTYSREQIEQMVSESRSFRDLAERMGYQKDGGSIINRLQQVVKNYNIDTSHFLGQGWNKNNFDYDRFQYGNTIKSSDAKNAIIFLRGHKCESCGLEEWLNQKIPLEVHHIDGDHKNNALDNLQLLCPNCHALTKNWRGRNISKKEKIIVSEESFVNALKDSISIRQALISLGLIGAGGNYDRAYELINKYNIEHLKK